MRLELDELDLKPGTKLKATRDVSFDHLNENAHKAVSAVGSGKFVDDRGGYEAVDPPGTVVDE